MRSLRWCITFAVPIVCSAENTNLLHRFLSNVMTVVFEVHKESSSMRTSKCRNEHQEYAAARLPGSLALLPLLLLVISFLINSDRFASFSPFFTPFTISYIYINPLLPRCQFVMQINPLPDHLNIFLITTSINIYNWRCIEYTLSQGVLTRERLRILDIAIDM